MRRATSSPAEPNNARGRSIGGGHDPCRPAAGTGRLYALPGRRDGRADCRADRSVSRFVSVLIPAVAVLVACGTVTPTATGPLMITGTLPGGQVLDLTIDDQTGLVDAVSFVAAQSDVHDDETNGVAIKNVAGDTRDLFVTWLGRICHRTKVEMTI